MRLLLRAPLNPHSGYGNDGIGLATALSKAGVDVYLDPTFVQAPLPEHVASLLTKRLEPPFDLLLHHVDPAQLGISEGARGSARVTAAMTMWEFSTLDNLKNRRGLKKRLSAYDVVVGYDTVSTAALKPYVSTKQVTVQGGYWPQQWPRVSRSFEGTFRFCMVGALHARKDPMVAIEAFRELREEHPELDVELNVKTVAPGLHSRMAEWIPGLNLFYETWPEEKLRQFYGQQHVLLAPSRGEGKNMPALEFMSTGGTVIATNWGGHQQWLSSSYAYPLDYSLGPVNAETPTALWAKADKDHLKALMLHCATHRDEVQRKGDMAAQVIPQSCSWSKVIDRLFTTIGAAVPGSGEALVVAARMAQRRAQDSMELVAL